MRWLLQCYSIRMNCTNPLHLPSSFINNVCDLSPFSYDITGKYSITNTLPKILSMHHACTVYTFSPSARHTIWSWNYSEHRFGWRTSIVAGRSRRVNICALYDETGWDANMASDFRVGIRYKFWTHRDWFRLRLYKPLSQSNKLC